MSHIVTIQTEVRSAAAVAAACARLKLPEPRHGTFALFSGKVVGLGVELPGWRYPLVCQLDSGQLRYDNFEGRWGRHDQRDLFLQAYAVESARLAARRKGHSVSEHLLADGSIRLTIELGGAA